MNRYPLWKYVLIALAIAVGGLYALPNLFGEAPAVQVSVAKTGMRLDAASTERVEAALKAANIAADSVRLDGSSIKARFPDTETQLKAKDAIQKALNPNLEDASYVVALNLISRSPAWLTSMNASPM